MPTIKETLTRLAGSDLTDDELAERLPVGYRDPKSRNYIPEAVRCDVADFPAAERDQIRRTLIRGGSTTATYTVGSVKHGLDPTDSDEALETVTQWVVVKRCRDRQRDAANSAVYEAAFRGSSGCEAEGCDAYGSEVRSRRYGDGSIRRFCARHDALEVPEALERIQAEERAKR